MSVQRVVIDTQVFLSARDASEPGESEARKVLEALDDRKAHAIVSVVTIAELSAGFETTQVPAPWPPFLGYLRASPSFTIDPADEAVALTAGKLRSETGLRLPGAFVVAIPLRRGPDCVVTEDRPPPRVRVPVVVKRPRDIPL